MLNRGLAYPHPMAWGRWPISSVSPSQFISLSRRCALTRPSSLWCIYIPSCIILILTCSISEWFTSWANQSTPSYFIIMFWYSTVNYLSSQSYLVTMYKDNWPFNYSGTFFPYISSVKNIIFEQRSVALSTFSIHAPINEFCTLCFLFFSFSLLFVIGCDAPPYWDLYSIQRT